MEDEQQNLLDALKHVDNSLLLIVGLLISISLFTIFSQGRLDIRIQQKQYNLTVEFLENQQIFHKYLEQKRELYLELNNKAIESDSSKYDPTLYKNYSERYQAFAPIFSGRSGFGWSKDVLDDRYNFGSVMEDFFLSDWNYWTTKGKLEMQESWPNISEDDADIEKRLKHFIKDKFFIRDFFARNLELKMFFFKDILQKYDLAVADTIFSSLKLVMGGDYEKSFRRFLNDSTRITFHMISSFGPLIMGDNFYETHDSKDAICKRVYKEYIKDKFTVFDNDIFNNKLPYSSYVDKVKRIKEDLAKKLEGQLNTPSDVNPPFTPIQLDIVLFYKLIFWIFYIFSITLRNLLAYRNLIIDDGKNQKNNKIAINAQYYPTILNVLVMNFKHRQKAIRLMLFIILLSFLSTVLLGVNLQYYGTIYQNFFLFLIFGMIPFILSILSFYFKFDSKALIRLV